MRIVMLAEVSAERVIGGAERVLREQAVGLRALGHDVTLIVRAPAEGVAPAAQIEGVTELRYPVERRSALAFLLTTIRGSLRAFDRLCGEAKPDAVVVQQAAAGLGPILRRQESAARWVYCYLSPAHEEYLTRTDRSRNALLCWIHASLRRRIESLVVRRCDRAVVLSEFSASQIARHHRYPPDRIVKVPGATDAAKFRLPTDKAAVRRELKLDPGQTVLFTVRNLVPRMGLENLIEALAQRRESLNKTIALIAGTGPLRESLRNRIAELRLGHMVRLIGFVSEADLVRYYQAADLMVLPTASLEGFGLVSVEALACGTPVLGTPVGAIPEVLAELDARLLAKGNDASSLADAIQAAVTRIQSSEDEWVELGRRSRELVERTYNWQTHCARLEKILKGQPIPDVKAG